MGSSHYPVCPQTSNNIIQKGLAFVRERSGSVSVPGTTRALGSCPAGCMAEVGLWEEVCADGTLLAWRRDVEAGPVALRITKQGLEAITVEDAAVAAPEETAICAAPVPKVETSAAEAITSRTRISAAAQRL